MVDRMDRTLLDLRDEETIDRLDDRGLLRLILHRGNKALSIIERMSLDQTHLKLAVDDLEEQNENLFKQQKRLQEENASLRKEIATMRRIASTVPRFTSFTKLPPEIRCSIWDFALPRRFVRVERRGDLDDVDEIEEVDDYRAEFCTDRLLDVNSRHAPPAVSQVCREARAIATRTAGFRAVQHKHSPQNFDGYGVPPKSYKREWTWFDSARDTLIRPDWVTVGQDPDYQHLDKVVQHVFVEASEGTLGSTIPDLFSPRVCPKLRSVSFIVSMIRPGRWRGAVWDMPAPSVSAHWIPRDNPYDVFDIDCPTRKAEYDGELWFIEDEDEDYLLNPYGETRERRRERHALQWRRFREELIVRWQSERPQEQVPEFKRVLVRVNDVERSPKGPAKYLED